MRGSRTEREAQYRESKHEDEVDRGAVDWYVCCNSVGFHAEWGDSPSITEPKHGIDVRVA